jgi:ferrous iron transport protein B
MSCHSTVQEPVDTTPVPVGTVRMRTVALIGPPNCGKSTLFNRLTGMRQKVANYPGVTVEHHSGKMKSIGRNDLTLIDLPGIYSLATYSEDARNRIVCCWYSTRPISIAS